jgi:hypothetical protein
MTSGPMPAGSPIVMPTTGSGLLFITLIAS